MNWNFYLPVKIVFGAGSANNITEAIGELGCRNGVLVCDPIFVRNGLADKIIQNAKGSLSAVFCDVKPNPTVDDVDRCVQLIRKHGADFAVALGGGSTIDCAKAACAIAKAGDTIRNYHTGGKPLCAEYSVPLIAVPTTAGTGSEVTSVTVLTDNKKQVKAPLGHPLLLPKTAVVDPLLTLSVPKDVTASTGLDIMSHALEGFWSVNHQPVCDALALSAARNVFQYLPAAYDNPGCLEAREKLCEASLLAGVAFSHPKTSGPHACSFPLTNIYGLPHGEACAFTLDAFTRLNAEAENGRLHVFARDCGFHDAYEMAEQIAALKVRFNMKRKLTDIGVTAERICSLAANSMHPNMLNNPVVMSVGMVEKLYRGIG